MDHSKNIGRKALFIALVIGMALLFLGQAAQAQSGTDQKTMAKEVGTWKTLIGNRYQIERSIDVHGSPFSPETRGIGPGQTFTVKDLIVDPTDPHNAAYAVRLDDGKRAYLKVRDLQQLIQSRSVVTTDTGSDRSKKRLAGSLGSTQAVVTVKEQPQAAPIWGTDLPRVYRTVAYSTSRQLSDVLRGDIDFEDLPMLMIVAGVLFGLAWALWQMMGCAKTLSFLGSIPLLYWLNSELPGRLPLVPFLALLILLVILLGVWTFVRFAIILAGSVAVGYVVHAVHHEIGNVALALVSLTAAAIVGVLSFFLFRITHGIERVLHQE